MKKSVRFWVGGTVLVCAGIGGAVTAKGSLLAADDDGEVPITGEALEKASKAALDHLGEGRVTETEVGDEDSYYEVEVTLPDGRQVDVQLDEEFHVVSTEADDESEEGDGD